MIPRSRYFPFSSVTVEAVPTMVGLEAMTVTPGSGPPSVSVTTPSNFALTPWAMIKPPMAAKATRKITSFRIFFIRNTSYTVV